MHFLRAVSAVDAGYSLTKPLCVDVLKAYNSMSAAHCWRPQFTAYRR
jgi:hypothetical protein